MAVQTSESVSLERDRSSTDTVVKVGIEHKCLICSTKFSGRRGAKYCSPKCRNAAWYQRERMKSIVASRQMNVDSLRDVLTVRKVSEEAADIILRQADLCGNEVAGLTLDAIWAVLVAVGVDLIVLQRN